MFGLGAKVTQTVDYAAGLKAGRFWGGAEKNGGRIEIQPRFKIQYPMKNHNKDA
jgi:hypothetical protein